MTAHDINMIVLGAALMYTARALWDFMLPGGKK
jgi:hypothetical protein